MDPNAAPGQFLDGAELLQRNQLQRPGRFSGEEADWTAWSFKFDSFAACAGWADNMDTARAMDVPVSNDQLGERAGRMSTAIYHTLVQLMDGRALAILQLTPRGNGLEAWRLLCREFQPRVGGRFATMLRAILRPDWWLNEPDFRRALAVWDGQVLTYDAQSGEPLSERIKTAVIMEFAPKHVSELLALSPPETRDSYPLLRDALRSLSDANRVYSHAGFGAPLGGPAPMDTSAAIAAAAMGGSRARRAKARARTRTTSTRRPPELTLAAATAGRASRPTTTSGSKASAATATSTGTSVPTAASARQT